MSGLFIEINWLFIIWEKWIVECELFMNSSNDDDLFVDFKSVNDINLFDKQYFVNVSYKFINDWP